MTKTVVCTALVAVFITMLNGLPAHAQHVFVSGSGLDTNPCTFAQPCRTFQQAFITVSANGEIDVLDPTDYGPLTITHAISVQSHGFGSIIQSKSTGTAITISAGGTDMITLDGLIIDGAGSGANGIVINKAGSVQILNCVIRHFGGSSIVFQSTSNPTNLLVSDTVASDDDTSGIFLGAQSSSTATLNRVTASDNGIGVTTDGGHVVIANSVLSNNTTAGLDALSHAAYLAKSVVAGNGIGVLINHGATVHSYEDNYINTNGTDVSGTLTKVSPK
jgi:hypothetical protein